MGVYVFVKFDDGAVAGYSAGGFGGYVGSVFYMGQVWVGIWVDFIRRPRGDVGVWAILQRVRGYVDDYLVAICR